MTQNLNLNDITDFVENTELEDQSISTGGGDFKRELLPAKTHAIRLVGYTEIGKHMKKKYQSEEKVETDLVRLTFEVLSKDGLRLDDDKKVVGARRLYIEVKKSNHEKATLRKMFELMREGDSTVTHFAQMIGVKAWKLKVQWEQGGKKLLTKKAREDAQAALEKDPDNKDLRIWEVWRDEGVPMISPAVIPILDEDGEDTGEIKPMKVHEVVGKYEFFLWDQPQTAHWESLFIEGEYERKDADGKTVKQSKNRVQETILSATNYEGSPLQCLLDGVEFTPPEGDEEDEKKEEPKKGKKAEKAEPEPEPEEAEEAEEPEEAEEEEEDDEMDELGL